MTLAEETTKGEEGDERLILAQVGGDSERMTDNWRKRFSEKCKKVTRLLLGIQLWVSLFACIVCCSEI